LRTILETRFYSYRPPSHKYPYSTPPNPFVFTIHQSSYQSAVCSFWIINWVIK